MLKLTDFLHLYSEQGLCGSLGQWLYASLEWIKDSGCMSVLPRPRIIVVYLTYQESGQWLYASLISFKAILIIKFLCQIAGQWLYSSPTLFLVVSVWCVAVCQAIVILKSSGSMPVQSCIVFLLFDKGFPLLHIYRGFFPFSQVTLK